MLLNEIKQNINSRSLHISDDKKSLDNFWKWFGNSKVVDDYNRPLIMYHGTDKEFTKFEKEKIGKKLLSGKGFYFDSNKSIAKKFGKNIISCYLKIENPFIIDERENSLNNQQKIYKNTEELIKQGYDGIIIIDDKGRECVIFEPNQIKSINNNGNWSLESNDINEGLKMNKLKKLLESTLAKDFKIIKEETYILNEGIEEIKKYYPKIDDNMIKTLVALDPTYQGGEQLGKYGKWILNLYNRKLLKDEDFYKVTEYLTTFVNNLSKMPNKDIMTYKSLPDLAKAIQGFEGQKDISKKQQVRDIKKGAKKIMETNDWLVIQPTTEESACYYGANTKWCTASKENSMFNYYNEQGPLYIFINKKDNSKYQFHAESLQFMNELDESTAPKKVINDKKILKFIEKKVEDYIYEEGLEDDDDDSLLPGLYADGEDNLFIGTDIDNFFDTLYSEDCDINRQAIDIIKNYFRGEIVETEDKNDEELTFNSTVRTLFKLYFMGRILTKEHINTMISLGFNFIDDYDIIQYFKELKEHPLKDNDVRIYELFEKIENEIIHQINANITFFKVIGLEYTEIDDEMRIMLETINSSNNLLDANIDWFMNVNENLYTNDVFEEIAHKVETPRTNNNILTEMLIHGIIKIINEDSETKSFNVEKNPKEDVVETYLKSSSLRFAFNPMNNDFLICDDLHNPIPLNESADKYITGILSPNLVEITSYVADDYNDSKEIVENLLGKRFKKIFKNHYEIII